MKKKEKQVLQFLSGITRRLILGNKLNG